MWGPKRQATNSQTEPQYTLSKPISAFDSSIDPKDVERLQYFYSREFESLLLFPYIVQLFQKFGFYYGPSISHRGLRAAVLAYGEAMSISSPDNVSQSLKFAATARRELIGTLLSPALIGEAELFTSALLALVEAIGGESGAFELHIHGFLAIMRHLAQNLKLGKTYSMVIFWPLARDAIYFHSAVFFKEEIRWEKFASDIRQILGFETFEQQQRYEKELADTADSTSHIPLIGLVTTTMQQIALLGHSLQSVAQRGVWGLFEEDAAPAIVYRSLKDEIIPIEEDEALAYVEICLGMLQEGVEEMTAEDQLAVQSLVGQYARLLILLALRRFLLISVSQMSIGEGILSIEARDAGRNYISLVHRIGSAAIYSEIYAPKDVEESAEGQVQKWRAELGYAGEKFSEGKTVTCSPVTHLLGTLWSIYEGEDTTLGTVYEKFRALQISHVDLVKLMFGDFETRLLYPYPRSESASEMLQVADE